MAISQVPSGQKDTGEWLEVTRGERFTIRTPCNATHDAYVVFEVIAEPRNGVPLHIHEREEEFFIILEGTAHMVNGDETLQATAGAAVTVGKGIPHAWCNLTDMPLRMLVIFTPGHIEGLFREASRGTARILALADAYGTRFVGPVPSEGIYSIISPRP